MPSKQPLKMNVFPLHSQVVNMSTGKVTEERIINAEILPAAFGCCQECGVKHGIEYPHNVETIRYQYVFFGREGRWPTWADAMAHCSDPVRQLWTKFLTERGIEVNSPEGGQHE